LTRDVPVIFLNVFALGGLVCCWIWSDVSTTIKCVLSVLYAASWGLLFCPEPFRYIFPLSQAGFAILFGGITFGIDWLMRDGWHVR
jgi:hypothetical protein